MTEVYRISRRKYQDSVLSGIGGLRVASRWNLKGDSIVYSSASRSLALLEMLVHMDIADMRLMGMMMYSIQIPERVGIYRPRVSSLPEHWDSLPYEQGSQSYWRTFKEGQRAAVLCIPSVILPQEYNYLINPDHPDSRYIKVKDMQEMVLDARLEKEGVV